MVKPNLGINRRLTLIDSLLLFTIFFPYIPGIFPSDTQPWFLILFAIWVVVKSPSKNSLVSSKPQKTNPTVFIFLMLLIFTTLSISIITNLAVGLTPKFARVIAFLQFLCACYFGYNYNFLKVKENIFFVIVLIYLIFTPIFFVTNGAVEDLLVSREKDIAAMLSRGRGAMTLSAEPSFFALSMLNIFVIRKLIYPITNFSATKNHLFNLIVFTNLFLSFSGIGMGILIALMLEAYLYVGLILGILILLMFNSQVMSYIDDSNIRSIKLIKRILNEGLADVLLDTTGRDRSFNVRLQHFIYYYEEFLKAPILGHGFYRRNTGGGFISLICEVGFSLLLMIILSAIQFIIFGNWKFRFKMLVLFWLMLRFLSDSIGIPGIGVILGLMYKNKYHVQRTN